MSRPTIAPNIAIRTAPSSGSMRLVSQAKQTHAHQTTASDEQAAAEARPGRVGGHERGALGEAEDEDEVEEELERLDRLPVAQLDTASPCRPSFGGLW